MNLLQRTDKAQSTKLPNILIALALLILVASYGTWFYFSQTNADRQFWSMIDTSLKANSYTSSAVQSDNGQKLEQVIQLSSSQAKAVSVSKAIQPGTTVTTEVVGTPTEEYIRYANIQTDEAGPSGKKPDYTGLQNVWGKYPDPKPGVTDGQLYSQAALGIIPIANLNSGQRQQLIAKMQAAKVYKYDLTAVEQSGLGRTLTYTVTLNVKGYITVLKDFTSSIGLNQFESVDPEQFNSAQPVQVVMKVNSLSHQLTELSYGEGARTEKLSGFGSRKVLPNEPAESIPLEQLQAQLQAIK